MGDPSDWHAAYLTLGVILCGLGLLLLFSLDRTRTNLCIGPFYISVGLAVATVLPLVDDVDRSDPGWTARLQGGFEVAVFVASLLYLSSLLATAQASPRSERIVTWAIRAGFALAAWHAVASFLFPAERLDDFQMGVFDQAAYERAGFWLFATFWIVTAAVFAVGFVTLARQHLDGAERGRAFCSFVGTPPLIAIVFLPPEVGIFTGGVAMLIILLGQFRYMTAQGRRSAFLSRFLSPDVSSLVDAHGLAEVMKPHEVELTVVCCDLRGFTAYAEAVPSQAVIDLLGEYYDAVGDAVAAHGGTIKDYAGDGVLVLVGAPLPRPDHAVAGLALASQLLAATRPAVVHWATGVHPLGVGLGVASGRVTVGAIGSSARMEYTAVGTAVNLAARLCSAAADGEILVDHRTVELAGTDDVAPRGSLQVKGLSSDQAVYAVLA